MKITIIIPTFRPQPYLYECLNSLCEQTLDKAQFEVLVVLNGCADPWISDIRCYIDQNMQGMIVHLLHTDILGVSNARNIGLDKAVGEYICFVDDDDYLSSTYLEEILKDASKTNIVLSNSIAFDEQGNLKDSVFEQSFKRLHLKGKIPYQYARKFFSGPCMKIIHRDIIGDRRFDINFKNGEDALYMFLLSNQFHTVSFTSPDAVYYRRLRSNSAHRISVKETWRSSIKLMIAYSIIYWKHIKNYSLNFYVTRLLGAVHRILVPES